MKKITDIIITLFRTKFGPTALVLLSLMFFSLKVFGKSSEAAPYIIMFVFGAVWAYFVIDFVKSLKK